jgi:hypothetical protein
MMDGRRAHKQTEKGYLQHSFEHGVRYPRYSQMSRCWGYHRGLMVVCYPRPGWKSDMDSCSLGRVEVFGYCP